MAEVMQFKTESKRLLELMINSIYSNKEIFIRELISNASDAIDKYHYLSLTEDKLPKKNDYEIILSIDKENKTLTITDNGIGMTHDELINSLGTIAKSGSLEFMEKLKEANKESSDIDIIGQFGVGFYSAFMVAKKIEVRTRSLYDEKGKGYLFTSTGEDTFSIEEIDKEDSGTEITLYLRDNNEEYDYDDFLDTWKIKDLVKRYSDYVRYPIKLKKIVEVEENDDNAQDASNDDNQSNDEKEEDKKKSSKKSKAKKKAKEKQTTIEYETLNSMIPIWKRNKNEVEDKDYNEFYKSKFYDAYDPSMHILVNVEGKVNYTTLLFIPSKAPYNLYSEKYEKGLQLYCKGVFIMDKCKELLPDYLRFVKGLVDSSDLDLNISRELLQKSKVLKDIADNVEKKIVSKLEGLMKSDFDQYLEFYKNYGLNLKFGAYEDFGAKKDLLKDLILYNSVNEEKMISFKQYVEKMKEDQKFIYYVSAKNKESVMAMPQMDVIKKHGYDVLILTDDVDEFLIRILGKYDEKEFKSINQGDLDLLDDESNEKIKELNEEKKPLLDAIKEALKDDVKDVILSKRLTDSAVCLVSSDGLSFEMEKVLSAMPNNQGMKAERVLEINPNHPLFNALENIYLNDPTSIKNYADLLYSQALIMEGFSVKDPVEFSNKMCELMIKSSNK